VVNHEVPVSMVALVATALYVTIYEWCTGEQQVTEFSANAYLDVYHGNVNTLTHIRENREGAFHLMMADIYRQANPDRLDMVARPPEMNQAQVFQLLSLISTNLMADSASSRFQHHFFNPEPLFLYWPDVHYSYR
ncbi:hypothetical protein BJY52DRAFT_1232478, partial [Lactarius psammicola]